MANYSYVCNTIISEANTKAVVTGADSFTEGNSTVNMLQSAYNNITQSGIATVTHDADALGKRIVQVSEFVEGGNSLTNTTLDFDLIDESNYIQEDTVSGTDFIGGIVQLHEALISNPATYDATKKSIYISLGSGDTVAQNDTHNGLWHAAASNVIMSGADIYYWERVLTAGTQFHVGAYNASISPSFEDGTAGDNGWGFYYPYAFMVANTNIYEYITASAPQGSVVGVAFQPSTGKIWSHLNGTWLLGRSPDTSPDTPYYTVTAGLTWRPYDDIYWAGNQLTARNTLASCQYDPTGVVGLPNYETVIYPTSQPYYITTSDASHINLSDVVQTNSVTITTSEPSNTYIKGLVSFDGRATWKKYVDPSFVTHSGIAVKTGWNTMAEIEAALVDYTITDEATLDFAFLLNTSDAAVTPSLDQVTLNYDEAGFYTLKMNSDYTITNTTSTTTKVVKNSAGSSNIKVSTVLP